MGFRLTKDERLLKRGDFLGVSRNPDKRFKTTHFIFLLKPNQLPQTRLGVTVSKKVGKAVKRNRVKRHIREFFRKNKHSLPPGVDLLIIARQGAADIDARLLKAELHEFITSR